jgi:hypothetical protein
VHLSWGGDFAYCRDAADIALAEVSERYSYMMELRKLVSNEHWSCSKCVRRLAHTWSDCFCGHGMHAVTVADV